jgi:hypothetical protein
VLNSLVTRSMHRLLLVALPFAMAGACLAQTQAQTQAQAPAAPRPASAPARKADAAGPAWSALTAAQRPSLAPLEVSSRFAKMPPDEQQRVQARMAEWARLTPAERGQARWSFLETQQLSREQKQQHWEAYQALPDEERKALAARARPTVQASGPSNPAAVKPTALPAPAASRPLVNPVAPTIVQAKPGATTTLMTKSAPSTAPPPSGQPRIAAKSDQVDSQTLLPKSGPQAVASAPRKP